MKKGKNKKDKFFAKKNGSLLMLAGTLFLALTFILNTGGDLSYLGTRISRKPISPLGDTIGWEALMAITLSITLIVAGMIMFFASEKMSKK